MDSRVNRDCHIILWSSIAAVLIGFSALATFCLWGQV